MRERGPENKRSVESREGENPFQEFLYQLRKEELKVSTSEWIDLQKILAEGMVQNINDLYVISRSVLVKDMANYSKFDKVFSEVFFNIDFLEEEEENLSTEIVDPGFTELHHGGDDVHKAIEDSQSSGHEGGGIPDTESQESSESQNGDCGQGVIRDASVGYSAYDRLIERRYREYDKDQILNYDQIGRALSSLTAIIQESTDGPTGKLDIDATVKSIAQNAGIPELVWHSETEKKPKVILMFDVGGSTDTFRPIMEKLFAAAQDYLDDVEVYYFHNAIYGEVWPQKDGNYGKNFISLKEILNKDDDSKIIIIGDAWMAESELYDDYTDKNGRYFSSGLSSFNKIRERFDNVIWINPINKDDRAKPNLDRSGTIAELSSVFNMYDMTLNGIENAIKELMRE